VNTPRIPDLSGTERRIVAELERQAHDTLHAATAAERRHALEALRRLAETLERS
jgi:hypothetical protein